MAGCAWWWTVGFGDPAGVVVGVEAGVDLQRLGGLPAAEGLDGEAVAARRQQRAGEADAERVESKMNRKRRCARQRAAAQPGKRARPAALPAAGRVRAETRRCEQRGLFGVRKMASAVFAQPSAEIRCSPAAPDPSVLLRKKPASCNNVLQIKPIQERPDDTYDAKFGSGYGCRPTTTRLRVKSLSKMSLWTCLFLGTVLG